MAGAKKGTGSRRSRREWRSLLAKFDGSGLSVEAFCGRKGISAASLYRWRGLLSAVGDDQEAEVVRETLIYSDTIAPCDRCTS